MKRMKSEGIFPSIFKESHIMPQSGRFESSTKTRIHTSGGTVIKIVRYPEDSEPFTEYNIRPICAICKEPIECLCFNFNNSDDPHTDAVRHLQMDWICTGVECRLKYMKEDDPEQYERIKEVCEGEPYRMSNMISDLMPELEDGDFCSCA